MPELRIGLQLRPRIVECILADAWNDYQVAAGVVARCQDPQRIVASVAFRCGFGLWRRAASVSLRDPVSVARPSIFGVQPAKCALGRILLRLFRLFVHGVFHLLPSA